MDAETRTMVRAALDGSAYVAGANQVAGANDRMVESGEAVARTQEQQQVRTRDTGRAIEGLQRNLDQAYRSQQQFERAQGTINTALDRGQISAQRAAELTSLAQQRYMGASTASAALAAANDNAGRSTGRLGQVMGQAGFQIQDFAGQVAAGQSALVAFSQQGSQLLGVFGTGGAIAGAVLTVGLLAYQLLSINKEGEEAAGAIDTLAKSMEDAARDAERLATMLARVEGRFMSTMEAARQRRIRDLNTDAAELGRLENEAMLRALNREAEGRTAANQAASFRGQLDPSYGLSLSDQRGLRSRIAELEGTAASAQADADAARRDAARLGFNRRRTEALIQGEVQGDANSNPGRLESDPPERAAGRAERPGLDVASAVQQSLDDLTRAYDAYNTQVNLSAAGLDNATPILQRYAQEQQLLTQLLDAGIISEAQFGEEVERSSAALDRQLTSLQQRSRGVEQTSRELGFAFSSAFEDAILKGKELSEVLKGILQDIARIIIRRSITEPLNNAVTGAISSGFSSFFGGGATPEVPVSNRSLGGPVSPGVAYKVGELRPEIFVPSVPGRIVQAPANDAAPQVNYAITVNAPGADPAAEARIYSNVRRIVREESVDLVQRGGSYSRAFGR